MEPSPPGWYRDPHSPGGRRYWDGQAWVDVDAVLDAPPEPGPVATTGPRLISQRRADQEPPAVPEQSAAIDEIGEIDTESRPD